MSLYTLLEDRYKLHYQTEARFDDLNQDPNQQQVPEEEVDKFEPVKKIIIFNKIKELKFFLNIAEISDEASKQFSEINNILDVILDFFDLFEYDELIIIVDDLINDIMSLTKQKRVNKNE